MITFEVDKFYTMGRFPKRPVRCVFVDEHTVLLRDDNDPAGFAFALTIGDDDANDCKRYVQPIMHTRVVAWYRSPENKVYAVSYSHEDWAARVIEKRIEDVLYFDIHHWTEHT